MNDEWDRLFDAVLAVEDDADPAPYLAAVGFALADRPGAWPAVQAVVIYAAHACNDPVHWLVSDGYLVEITPPAGPAPRVLAA